MSVKLLIEHHLEFLSLKGGCTGSFESTRVKTPHCWKSHVTAQFIFSYCSQSMFVYIYNKYMESGNHDEYAAIANILQFFD